MSTDHDAAVQPDGPAPDVTAPAAGEPVLALSDFSVVYRTPDGDV